MDISEVGPISGDGDILLVEDSFSLASIYRLQLEKSGFKVTNAETWAEAKSALDTRHFRLVFLDMHLPDGDGLDLLQEIHNRGLNTAVVVVTADGSIERVVEAMRLGAYDFLVKPFSERRLVTTARNALERVNLQSTISSIQNELGRDHFHGFIGRSVAMQAIYRSIENVGKSKASVFITGESGTGKEVCAEAIHAEGPRQGKPFIALNCGAIPKGLIESEIFGHLKGSFTGAIADRTGAAAMADGGTLFLDEVCEMDVNLQSKLLRFLQTGKIQQVGSSTTKNVDVRVICATNRTPEVEVAEGRFREDLFYRLNVVPVHLPPLSERDTDVLDIAEHFLSAYTKEENKSFTGFTEEARHALLAYSWPGNVRELQNTIHSVIIMNDSDVMSHDMLPSNVLKGGRIITPRPTQSRLPTEATQGDTHNDSGIPIGLSLREIEKRAIEDTITACDGSIPKAAEILGVSPSTLYRKRETWLGDIDHEPA